MSKCLCRSGNGREDLKNSLSLSLLACEKNLDRKNPQQQLKSLDRSRSRYIIDRMFLMTFLDWRNLYYKWSPFSLLLWVKMEPGWSSIMLLKLWRPFALQAISLLLSNTCLSWKVSLSSTPPSHSHFNKKCSVNKKNTNYLAKFCFSEMMAIYLPLSSEDKCTHVFS